MPNGLERISKQLARRRGPVGDDDPARAGIWDHDRGRFVLIVAGTESEIEIEAKAHERQKQEVGK